MIFTDYIEACNHFNIDIGFIQSKSVADDIKAYLLLGDYMVANDLIYKQLNDGRFEVINSQASIT